MRRDAAVCAAPAVRCGFRNVELEGTEESSEGRASELVVEGGGADGAVEHDLQRRSDVRWPASVVLPWLDKIRNPQVRDREPGDTGLAARATSRRRLVANLAAGARRGSREGGDRGGMVVGLHLHHDFHPLRHGRVPSGVRIGNEPARGVPPRHGCIVKVRGQHLARVAGLRVADHVEQRPLVPDAVDRPGRVEDLVAAVLGVHLGEHHQLGIGRVPVERAEPCPEVVELLRAQGEAEGCVRGCQSCASVRTELDRGVGTRLPVEEERLRAGDRSGRAPQERLWEPGALRHSVVEESGGGERGRRLVRVAAGLRNRPHDAALDARDAPEGAAAGDVGGLGRPRRDRPGPRRHHDRGVKRRLRPRGCDRRGVEKLLESSDHPLRSVTGADEIDPASVEIGDRGVACACAVHEAFAAERRQGGFPPEQQEGGDGMGRSVHLASAMILEPRPVDGAAPAPVPGRANSPW